MIITSYLKKPILRKTALYMSNNNNHETLRQGLRKFNGILPGLELSIPLYLFEKIFTTLHYGEVVDIENIFIIEVLLGYLTYGTDRFIDALAYEKNSKLDITETKKKLYNEILDNKEFVFGTLSICYIITFIMLSHTEETAIFIPLLTLNLFYTKIKPRLGLLKAPFIGFMWLLASVVLPCVIYDNNFSIINDIQVCSAPFLTLMGTSNYADIADINEDIENNVSTIPVVFGEKKALYFSIFCMLLSTGLIFLNENYDVLVLENSLLVSSNIGFSFYAFNLLKKKEN